MSLYPILVDLSGRPCVVVGGGTVASRKVTGLLAAGARVSVIAPALSPGLERLASAGRITVHRRGYRPGDLRGCRLAIAATGLPQVESAVFREARRRGILVNAADDPEHCDFQIPAILRRGDLTVSVSTAGRAPALAVRIRQRLERLFGPHYGRFLELAGGARRAMRRQYRDPGIRRDLWYRLVDSDVLDLLAARRTDRARARMESILETPGGAPR